jgi:toxin FitB
MIVLDTNVLAETLRPEPAEPVRRWMTAQSSASLFTTTVSAAKMSCGLALLPAGQRRAELEAAVAAILAGELSGRVLPFDAAAASAFAVIVAARRGLDHPIADFEAQIAAIARSRGAALATRNVADFAACGIRVISPWAV